MEKLPVELCILILIHLISFQDVVALNQVSTIWKAIIDRAFPIWLQTQPRGTPLPSFLGTRAEMRSLWKYLPVLIAQRVSLTCSLAQDSRPSWWMTKESGAPPE
ncbi:hypothetical protein PMIN06_013138, partial [Paraphaeosphaeria minitans]